MYALATCNEIGHRRLIDMMIEFNLSDLNGIADFILENSRRATLERITALPRMTATGEMTIDGFDTPITLKVAVTVHEDRIVSNFDGTSGVDKKGINCPMVYTKAYACYALKVAIAPEIRAEPMLAIEPIRRDAEDPAPAVKGTTDRSKGRSKSKEKSKGGYVSDDHKRSSQGIRKIDGRTKTCTNDL